MDNQHRLIKGYGELSAEEIARINRIKELGGELSKLLDEQQNTLQDRKLVVWKEIDQYRIEKKAQPDASNNTGYAIPAELGLVAKLESVERAETALYNARAPLQTGLMWLIRSVARPEGFC